MVICYSGKSRPSARIIADELEEIGVDVSLERTSYGHADINWGRRRANATLNPDISNVVNKRVMRELFKEHNVPAPRLVSEQLVRDSVNGQTSYNPYMFIGRPDEHMKGRGFWLCKTPADVRRALRGTRRKAAATHFMEYVDSDKEYRVHIFKGKSIRISQKKFDDDDVPMYRKTYTTVKPDPNYSTKEVRKAAKKAVAAVGLDFGAVDIIANDEGVYVLEVNAAPGLGGTMPELYARVFKEWKEGLW